MCLMSDVGQVLHDSFFVLVLAGGKAVSALVAWWFLHVRAMERLMLMC